MSHLSMRRSPPFQLSNRQAPTIHCPPCMMASCCSSRVEQAERRWWVRSVLETGDVIVMSLTSLFLEGPTPKGEAGGGSSDAWPRCKVCIGQRAGLPRASRKKRLSKGSGRNRLRQEDRGRGRQCINGVLSRCGEPEEARGSKQQCWKMWSNVCKGHQNDRFPLFCQVWRIAW